MNKHIRRAFAQAIEIVESTPWEEAAACCPGLPRGWFELTRLSQSSRLEFVEQFWLSQLKEEVALATFLPLFFQRVDDIHLFAMKRGETSEAHLVYSLSDEEGFFAGQVPLSSDLIEELSFFNGWLLPRSYLAFQTIHSRFRKGVDIGVFALTDLQMQWTILQEAVGQTNFYLKGVGNLEPTKLIPFYNAFGKNYWTCLYADWFPDEMGCVTISDDFDGNALPIFLSFAHWLSSYLRPIIGA